MPDLSLGRLFPESVSTFRTPWQRDRDRIIHSSAFRRLKHKTQVFVEHEGDHYRTRLTHSIEVAQVARTMAGVLGLDLELTETIALAHDLGHTPFGHAGEDALAALMAPWGGFDHNAQALRIVTRLERHYADFDGLNLTWETLEGIAKHNGPVIGPHADPRHAGMPLPEGLRDADADWPLGLDTFAGAEAQVAAISDDIAYNHHDLQDGLRAGMFGDDDLLDLPIVGPAYAAVDARWPGLDPVRRRHEALRRVFGAMVDDAITTTRALIAAAAPRSADDIRGLDHAVVRFSDDFLDRMKEIRRFLFTRMYRGPRVMEERAQAARVMNGLFPLFMARPELMPPEWRSGVDALPDTHALARLVADYVSGMTDRFALQEHERLLG